MDVIKEAEVELLLLSGLQVSFLSHLIFIAIAKRACINYCSKLMTYHCQLSCPISNAITGFGK